MNKTKNIALILGVLVMSLTVSYLVLGEATADPPEGNVPAPLNVGTIAQTKAGDLGVGGELSVAGNVIANALGVIGGFSVANDTLAVDAVNKRVGIGTTTPTAKLTVAGTIESTSGGFKFPDGTSQTTADIKTKATMNVDGVVTSGITLTPEVYHIEATNAKRGTTVPLDMDIVERLCGDRDGCEVTLGMRYYDNARPHETASRGPYRFYYVGANGWWRLNTDGSGQDGNTTVQHLIGAWTCYFTDGEYNGYAGTDNAKGLGLLMWSDYQNTNTVCTLTINGNSGLGKTTGDLVYGAHTSQQCTDAGGTVFIDGTEKACQFTNSSCANITGGGGGWFQYKNWSKTTTNTLRFATISPCKCHCGDWWECSDQTVTATGHNWADAQRKSDTKWKYWCIKDWVGRCKATQQDAVTIYAFVSEVGCY